METAMAKKAQLNRESIVEILEAWARYRQGRIDGETGWPKQVLLGKLRDGMPGTNWPKCSGSGKVRVEAPGVAAMRVDCPVCDGEGRVRLDPTGNKVNPALIRGNGHRTHFDDDPISQRVDWLVCTVLTEDQRAVVILQYTTKGTQAMKARKLEGGAISQSYFSKILEEAENVLAYHLTFRNN